MRFPFVGCLPVKVQGVTECLDPIVSLHRGTLDALTALLHATPQGGNSHVGNLRNNGHGKKKRKSGPSSNRRGMCKNCRKSHAG